MSKCRVWQSGSASRLLALILLLVVAAPCEAVLHFTSTPYIATVSEAAPVGSILLNVTAEPGTIGSTLIYQIFRNPSLFQIDSVTGAITLVESLDYEQVTSYEFNVEALEHPDSVMEEVTVNVLNEDDNLLTCSQSLVVVVIVEGPPNPSSIALHCEDRDEPPPGSVSYQIMSGNDAGLFSIDTEGTIHVTADLDYEEQAQHNLRVSVTNDDTPPDSSLLLTILVVVKPTNEHSPVFDSAGMFSFSVSESTAVGSVIGTLSASDNDQGRDGELVFSIAPESAPSVFAMRSSTGRIILTGSLDYEQTASYAFMVTASDSSLDEAERRSATATVSISIEDTNEYAPTFSSEVYSVDVPETTTTGSELVALECTDEDSNSAITYSLASGDDAGHFSIDPATGSVVLVSAVEYVTSNPSFFQLSAQCEDAGDPSRSAQVSLFIEVEGQNRNLPPSLSMTEVMVELSEDSALGTTVTSLASVAADSNRGLAGPLQFLFTHNSNCPADLFQIDSTSGTVYTTGFLDHETAVDYVCIVSVSNAESPPAELDVFIAVTDVNDESPLCSPTLYTLSIPEDSAVGSDLLTLSCSDADSESLDYSIVGTSNTFLLSPSGMQATLLLLSRVDSDVLSTYNLHVDVSDSHFSTSLTVFIYVEPSNEYTPTFDQSLYDCSVAETADIGTVICTLTASDGDSGLDGEISYTIIGGNDNNAFAIDLKTGGIVLAGHIDYEMVQGHVILVQAADNGNSPLSSSAQVRIRVLDSNDHAPIISPLITTSVDEGSNTGSVVVNIECSDIDTSSNGDVTLAIQTLSSVNSEGDESSATGLFQIDSSTNDLVLDSPLDYETSVLHKLTLTCTDGGSPPLTTSSIVLVSVAPVNEFAPAFSQNSYSATIAESSSAGTNILQVVAEDMDAGLDGEVEYFIEPVEGGTEFLQISATSGSISTVQPVNCEWGRERDFIITAVDGGTPALSSQSQLRITLENCQLGQLTPQQTVYFANVMENSLQNSEVITVACDSERTLDGGNNPLEYDIDSPVGSPFQVDSVSGRISVSTPPDYEQATSHMLQLKCTDPNRSDSYAHFSVYVTILPQNEHTPEFTRSTYHGEIAEGVSPGTSVVTVEARDDDLGKDGSVAYSISENGASFVVDAITGTVYTLDYLDREAETTISFHVVAQDQAAEGDSIRSSSTEVTVDITDINDNSPECDGIFYHIKISLLTDVGQSLLSLECSDADTGLNSQLHYSLQAEPTSRLELFSLDESTGELTLAKEFDSNSALVHHMTITIADGGTPSQSTAVLVLVDAQSSLTTGVAEDGLADAEGKKNAVTYTVKYLSTKLWSDGAGESFLSAVARSVTSYCALLPEACSLQSGCAQFYRRKRSAAEYFYTTFSEDNVVLQSDSLREFASLDDDGATNLNVTLYVTLPEGIERADYRTTDYVVPGTTLTTLLRDDKPVIEAQVRDSVAPRRQPTSGRNDSWVWGLTVSIAIVLVGTCIVCTVIISVVVHRKNTRKSKGAVYPEALNVLSGGKRESHVDTHSVPQNNKRETNRRKSLRELAHNNVTITTIRLSGQRNSLQHPETLDEFSDDISTILLGSEESNESLQGQPRSSGSPADNLSSELNSNSAQSSTSESRPGRRSDSLGDYKQNFPFEPPRTQPTRHERAGMGMRGLQPVAAGVSRFPAAGRHWSRTHEDSKL